VDVFVNHLNSVLSALRGAMLLACRSIVKDHIAAVQIQLVMEGQTFSWKIQARPAYLETRLLAEGRDRRWCKDNYS
jgi:hypothetical protein